MIRIALGLAFTLSLLNVPETFAEIPSAIRLARAHQYDKVGRLTELPRFLWLSEECTPPAQVLLKKLLDYHQLAIRSTKPNSAWAKKAKTVYEEIYAELLRIEKENAQCFDSVARAYAVGAVAMLESSYDQSLLKLASYYAYDLPGWNTDVEFPRMAILSPTRRPKLGCGWTAPGEKYAFKSFGGYFCKKSTLAIDPFLPPSNLAASFVHEIDHLLRDKYGRIATSWDEVRELTIYDEALSATLSSFLQLRLALWPKKSVHNRSWHWSYEMTKSEFDQIPTRNGYQLDFDNNLFLKNGPVSQITKELESVVLAKPTDFLIASDILACKLPQNFTNPPDVSTWNMSDKKPKAFFKEKTKALWKEIFDRIQRAYFKDFRPLIYLSPAMPLFPSLHYQRNCFEMSPILAFYNNPTLSAMVLEPSTNVYPILNQIHALLGTPSASCQLFHRALKPSAPGVIQDGKLVDIAGLSPSYRGPLADYGGNCSAKEGNEGGKTDDEHAQPGNEGGKTNDERAKPGNEGGKTNDEGAKPGNEGGKTSLGNARPCLEIPQD